MNVGMASRSAVEVTDQLLPPPPGAPPAGVAQSYPEVSIPCTMREGRESYENIGLT